MKRFLAISFLALYIFTATECSQLLKLPVLAEHFTEHKKLNGQLSLFDFLYMHYTDHDANDNDHDRDMQLPFKSHDDCASANFTSVPQQHQTISLTLIPVITESTAVYDRLNFQSSYLSSIWQPPKSC